MQITIQLPALLNALRVIGPALSRTNPIRTASCAWTATGDHVTLRATSLDWDVQYTMEAEVAVPGEAWMPANLVRALPWGRFVQPARVRSSGREIEVRSGDIAYTLPLQEPGTATALAPALVPCAEAPGSALARAVLLGVSAAHLTPAAELEGTSAGEAEREGAWLEIDRDRITVSSTDRTRIAHATTPAAASARLRSALPVHAALALARAVGQADTAKLSRSRGDASPTLTLTAGPATVTVRALAVTPPDPARHGLEADRRSTRLRGPADRLTAGLRAALAVAGTDPYATVQLRTRRAHLVFQVASDNGRAAVSVALDHAAGSDTDVALPARALLAALAPLGGVEVTLSLDGAGASVLIAAEDGAVSYRGLLAASRKIEQETGSTRGTALEA